MQTECDESVVPQDLDQLACEVLSRLCASMVSRVAANFGGPGGVHVPSATAGLAQAVLRIHRLVSEAFAAFDGTKPH